MTYSGAERSEFADSKAPCILLPYIYDYALYFADFSILSLSLGIITALRNCNPDEKTNNI